ncbi:MAG: molybdenum cofactor biosynthesis protein MoaE [Anaerolineales bacterium]|nr:molybdenum cofactor biosynthesis protein MoaE [Anaerolineales bacterium]
MNKVTVFLFARVRELIGKKTIEITLPDGAKVHDLKKAIVGRYPQTENILLSTLVAINKEYADDEQIVPLNAEIAMFPHVSGGESPTIFIITEEEIDLNDLLKKITLPTTGAACIFAGLVRGVTKRGTPHDTSYLVYEAYEEMATAKLHQIADEIRERWPSIVGIAIVQRLGKLLPGTPTVFVGCSASHRDTGVFEAASYGINRLKEIVPIWKKEVGLEGAQWVEGNYHPKPGE